MIFLKNSFLLVLLLLFVCKGIAQHPSLLPRSTPEREGISSEVIQAFLKEIKMSQVELHSLIILRHAKVITKFSWQPYSAEEKHMLYSITKSFISIAIGFAVDQKLLSVNDKVVSFFPELVPFKIDPYWSGLTVKHLLTMSVGQHAEGPYADPIALAIEKADEWVKLFFEVPILYEPGSRFLYNTLASHVLSAIVQKVTGMHTADYLTLKLFKPLGIKDLDWEQSPTGVNTGGWGLRLTIEDMAKVGQLFLQKGRWGNRQILSKEWISESTSFKIRPNKSGSADTTQTTIWNSGYGYQWWLYNKRIYCALGLEGQILMVMPEQDAIIAITANVTNIQQIMNLIGQHLIAGMKNEKLPANPNAVNALNKEIAGLLYFPEKGTEGNSIMQTFQLAANDMGISSVFFDVKKDNCIMILNTAMGDFPLHFGKEKWVKGETIKKGPYRMHSPTSFAGLPPFKVAGSFCWTGPRILKLTLRYTESPHYETYTCQFNAARLTMEFKSSMNVTKTFFSVTQ